MNLLEVKNLNVWDGRTGAAVVSNVSFALRRGSCLAIVGESGSGKSITCKAVMRLLPAGLGRSGDIVFDGKNLAELQDRAMRKLRGRRLNLIMQNGMRAFDPTRPAGAHLTETLGEHSGRSRADSAAVLLKAMESVMLRDPAELMRKYPHQLSGGTLQRMMIALAVALEPDVVIADEPTTALDAITQAEVVGQFARLRERTGAAMIVVSHDLAVVRRLADDVIVMKDGEIVERGSVGAILKGAHHPYTRYLVSTRMALSRQFEYVMGGGGLAAR